MAQQSERDFPLDWRGCRLLAEQRDFILEILLTARGDELQHRAAVFFVRHHEQTPPLAALVGFIGAQKRQQRLFTRGVQSDLQANVQGFEAKIAFFAYFFGGQLHFS